jgi:predicted Zn-dependent peptidase
MTGRLFTIAAAAVLASSPVAAQDYPPQPPIGTPKAFTVPASETYTLPNGMQVTLIPYGNTPKAVVNLRVYAGGVNEKNDVWLSQLTSQMFREGTTSKTGAQVADAAAAMGGNLGVGSGTQVTAFGLSVLSDRAPDAVRLMGDVARHPAFPASELERVRQNLLRSLAVAKSQPQPAADAALAAVYYGANSPYGRAFPTEAQLKRYTIGDLQRFYAANFGAKRAHIYVAGQFDKDAVRAAIEQTFADWQPGPARLKLKPTVHPGPHVVLVDRPGAAQSTIRLAFPAPPAGAPNDIPFRVTNALLGGSFTSRITNNIREQKGYTYSPYSYISYNPGEAQWEFDADVTTNVTGPALKEVFGEIRRLQAEAPPQEEATGMRTWMAGTFVLQNASAAGLVGSIAERDSEGLPADWLDTYVPAILATDSDQMEQLARKELPLNKMTLVVVGDLKTVRPQLKALPELRNARMQVVKPFG